MKVYLPALIWALIIFVLSTMPAIQLPETFFSPDKLAHAIIYGVLVVLMLWALVKKNNYQQTTIFWAIFISGFYGMLMEIIQYTFFPGRSFEVGDNIANVVGCFLGWILFDRFLKHKF